MVKKKVIKKVSKSKKAIRKKLTANLPERVSTGIFNFDRLISGGFEKGSTNLVVGGSGAGKSIFATQFLIEGIERGEKCLYITFEEKKEQFFENMAEFGWDLAEFEKKGNLTFLEYSPSKVKAMLDEGGGEVESVIIKNQVSRIVIDSITSFELLFEDELSKREAALELFGLIRGWNATALLTLEEDVSPHGEFGSRALKFEADSLVVLYYLRLGKSRKRFLEILKMRGTHHSKDIYPFHIKEDGVMLEKNPSSEYLKVR